MRIQATPLTSGPVTPGLEAISGGYRWQGIPDWTPNDPRYREGSPGIARIAAGSGADLAATAKRQRLDRFTEILAELGCPDPVEAPNAAVNEAGRRIGVTAKTAKAYRTALRRQRGASRDD